jgi:hypothetical protein
MPRGRAVGVNFQLHAEKGCGIMMSSSVHERLSVAAPSPLTEPTVVKDERSIALLDKGSGKFAG